MKAMIYGHEKTIKKISGLLTKEGIEVRAKLEGFPNAANSQSNNDFDLAIVDSRINTAEATCQSIRESGNTPIALLIDSNQTDWNRLLSLDADCYIQESRVDAEVAARLRAILRRYSYRTQLENNPVSENEKVLTN